MSFATPGRSERRATLSLVLLASAAAVSVALATQGVPSSNLPPSRVAAILVLLPADGTQMNLELPLPVGLSASTVSYWSYFGNDATPLTASAEAPRNASLTFQRMIERFVPYDGTRGPVVSFSEASGGLIHVRSAAVVAIGVEWTARRTLDLDPFANSSSVPDYLEIAHDGQSGVSRVVYLSWTHSERLAALSGTCDFVVTSDRPEPITGEVSLIQMEYELVDLATPRSVGFDGLVPLSQGQFQTSFN